MTALPLRVLDVAPGTDGVTAITAALRARFEDQGDPFAPVPAVSRHVTTGYADLVRAAIHPEEPVAHADAAVILATSGSTGDPRGVTITRANLRSAHAAAGQAVPRLASAPWVLALPATTIGGLVVVARALLSDQPVHVLPSVGGARAFDPADLARLPAHCAASIVPAQLSAILDHPAATAWLRDAPAVLVGGGRTPPALVDRAREAGISIVLTYGMTETTGGCVYDGIALPGMSVKLEEDGRIRVRGPMVAAGYRDNATGSRVRFDGDAVLTADLGRWSDEHLEVIGRADDVVVVNGVNVSPHAVEEALLELPVVREAAVVAVPDDRQGARLVAFAVCHEPVPPVDALVEWVAQRLGPAARPDVRVATSLPRLPHGKIDRMSLLREAGAV